MLPSFVNSLPFCNVESAKIVREGGSVVDANWSEFLTPSLTEVAPSDITKDEIFNFYVVLTTKGQGLHMALSLSTLVVGCTSKLVFT